MIEESGAIEASDLRDPNHAQLRYDAYTFEARRGDPVRVEVTVDGFETLLKLVEVSTGAVIAEWDPAYADTDALEYRIAGDGTYEARVYAMDEGLGTYNLTVRVGE